jgi:transposase
LKSWLPADDVADFIVAAVERVPLGAFSVPRRSGGKAQYHPRLMLALLIYAFGNGVFSSRRIERTLLALAYNCRRIARLTAA